MTMLKPCPFCGERVKIINDKFLDNNHFFIKCPTTDCITEYFCSTDDKKELIKAWNRRSEAQNE